MGKLLLSLIVLSIAFNLANASYGYSRIQMEREWTVDGANGVPIYFQGAVSVNNSYQRIVSVSTVPPMRQELRDGVMWVEYNGTRHHGTARSPRHNPGVRFRLADSSARFIALPGFRIRHRQQGARPHFGARAELRSFRTQHPRRFPGGQAEGPGPRRRRKDIAARLSPAQAFASPSPRPIYQRRLLHGHEPRRASPTHRATKGPRHEAGIRGVCGRPFEQPKGTWRQWLQFSRDELRQHVVSETQGQRPGSEAQEAITHYEVIAEYPLAGGKGFVTKLRLRLETGRNIKSASRRPTPDSH